MKAVKFNFDRFVSLFSLVIAIAAVAYALQANKINSESNTIAAESNSIAQSANELTLIDVNAMLDVHDIKQITPFMGYACEGLDGRQNDYLFTENKLVLANNGGMATSLLSVELEGTKLPLIVQGYGEGSLLSLADRIDSGDAKIWRLSAHYIRGEGQNGFSFADLVGEEAAASNTQQYVNWILKFSNGNIIRVPAFLVYIQSLEPQVCEEVLYLHSSAGNLLRDE